MIRCLLTTSAGMLALLLALVPAYGQQATRHVGAAAPISAPQHRYFGALLSTRGTDLLLRLRTGRLLRVDATEAFALKRVSEPLFAGKPTVVEGVLTSAGILRATAVRRAAPNPVSWGSDR